MDVITTGEGYLVTDFSILLIIIYSASFIPFVRQLAMVTIDHCNVKYELSKMEVNVDFLLAYGFFYKTEKKLQCSCPL